MNEQEKVVAMRIVENYKEMFDFLDFNPVDDLLNAEELSQAFKDFGKDKIVFSLNLFRKFSFSIKEII